MASHFWKGDSASRVAFVFSTPGRIEGEKGRPVSGDTGKNLDAILKHLRDFDESLFPSNDRYFYRITNASTKVMFLAQNDGKTEDTDKNISRLSNVERIKREIEGVECVILCGAKAKKLGKHLDGVIVVESCHMGFRGLRQTFKNRSENLRDIGKSDRDSKRRELCADIIKKQLAEKLP
ncbi:uracil-DNA glycosylase family protein [Salinivibrio sp. HTSP]|uniref:uracil-DNA glycosylase family protein n=1 Tax=Salinivibrio sp. HTSP TaxID=2115977 RepID=UPI000E311D56|nr:uracil-DNA glycosylase family protein [Salinivibrio sp. HTSP]